MLNKLKWFNFFIKSKNFCENNLKPGFKANFKFIYNEQNLIIYDWKLEIISCKLSKLTTESWFKNENSTFCKRKEFFDLIRQKQKPREFNTKTYTKNDLLSLNEKEIEKINFFIKSKIKKIKSLYNFIFGVNPAGELYLPKNAPIIMENPQEFFEHNFAIFFWKLFNIII